jgi:transcriptional regulator with XRE-family HTH domain
MSNSIEIEKGSFGQDARNAPFDQQDGGTGANIRRIRKERGLSAKEFAARIDTSPSQITRLEKGQRGLTEVWLNRIARGLDVAINDLLGEPALLNVIPVTYVTGRDQGDEVSKADRTTLRLPEDDRFFKAHRYGVLIGENHAGGRFAQGSIVICAALQDINEAMALGTHYHVRREGKDGYLSMICKLDQDPSGKLCLVPATDSPSLKTSMPYEGTSNTSVVLAGRVVGAYSKE